MIQSNQMIAVEDILDLLVVPLLGIVPDDEKIIISTNKGEPLVLEENHSLPATAFVNIAERLNGKSIPFLDFMAVEENLFSRLISFFKK